MPVTINYCTYTLSTSWIHRKKCK